MHMVPLVGLRGRACLKCLSVVQAAGVSLVCLLGDGGGGGVHLYTLVWGGCKQRDLPIAPSPPSPRLFALHISSINI